MIVGYDDFYDWIDFGYLPCAYKGVPKKQKKKQRV